MREGARADSLDARQRDGPYRGERDAARGFEFEPWQSLIAEMNALDQPLRVHVVEENDVDAVGCRGGDLGRDDRTELLDPIDFNLNEPELARVPSPGGTRDSADVRAELLVRNGSDVVVFQKHRVEEPNAMTAGTAAPDRVLLQRAKAGGGLASVVEPGAGAGANGGETTG